LLYPCSTSVNALSSPNSPQVCTIGGKPSFYENREFAIPQCELCNDELRLLLQIYAPIDDLHRTLYIFGCNRSLCSKSLWDGNVDDTGGGYGKKRSFCCFRSQAPMNASTSEGEIVENVLRQTNKKNEKESKEENTWLDENDNDDWGDFSKNDDDFSEGIKDIEAMIAASELQEKRTISPKSSKQNKTRESPKNENLSLFPCYDLEWMNEPTTTKKIEHDSDDDDDDIGKHDDAKLQKLLNQYLEEEEDKEIIEVIKATHTSEKFNITSSGGGREI